MRTATGEETAAQGSGEVLLSVRDLAHTFRPRGGGVKGAVYALRGVSFDVFQGECLALVGESGSGKTTLARSLLRLLEPAAGTVLPV